MPCILCGANEDNPHTEECPRSINKRMFITLDIEKKPDVSGHGRDAFQCRADFDTSHYVIVGTSIGEMLLNLIDCIRNPIALKILR